LALGFEKIFKPEGIFEKFNGNFLRFSGNVGVIQVFSPYGEGENSCGLKESKGNPEI